MLIAGALLAGAVAVFLAHLSGGHKPGAARLRSPTMQSARPSSLALREHEVAPRTTGQLEPASPVTNVAAVTLTAVPRAREQPEQVQPSTPSSPATTVQAKSESKADGLWKPVRRPDTRELVKLTVGLIPYGEVMIDGKSVGDAPASVKLSVGPHRIVGREKGRRIEKSVVVTRDVDLVVLDLRDAKRPTP